MEGGEGLVVKCSEHNTTVPRGGGVVLSVIFLTEKALRRRLHEDG